MKPSLPSLYFCILRQNTTGWAGKEQGKEGNACVRVSFGKYRNWNVSVLSVQPKKNRKNPSEGKGREKREREMDGKWKEKGREREGKGK